MTIKEFKTWLQGVMAFQNEGWKPTAKQWDVIYSKIQQLQDDNDIVQVPLEQRRPQRTIISPVHNEESPFVEQPPDKQSNLF